jgi:hypothetical protein
VNSLSRIPPSLAELPLRQKTPLLLGLYEFLLRAEKSKLLNWLELPCATLSFSALRFALRRGTTSPNAFSRSNKHVTRHVRRREDRLLRTSARMYFRYSPHPHRKRSAVDRLCQPSCRSRHRTQSLSGRAATGIRGG